MESYLFPGHFDLVTPDGKIIKVLGKSENALDVLVRIEEISPVFVGFSIDQEHVEFNSKSTLAQLGIHATSQEIHLSPKENSAEALVRFTAIDPIGLPLLNALEVGNYVGKLFAADPRRRVRNPDYLLRMFGRFDRSGDPLLSLGGELGGEHLDLEKIDGYTIAHLKLRNGVVEYADTIDTLLPTLAKALSHSEIQTRELLALHQVWKEGEKRVVHEEKFLLIKTLPLHIRTAFGRVVDHLLPKGVHHTSANLLQPDTRASGDIYEVFGKSSEEITQIPLEFYTLEPHREHVFFADRDQLQTSLDDTESVFQVFETAPKGDTLRTAVFVVKGEQMLALKEKDWIQREVHSEHFPGLFDLKRQSQMVEYYIKQQPSYRFLKAIEEGLITSQGVLFSRYFPSPLMKKMLLGDLVQLSLKGVYFSKPSQSHGDFFSHEDRTALLDLAKFAIPVYWVDETTRKILQFVPKPEKDTGMFVPIPEADDFAAATTFGVYGSNLLEPGYEEVLTEIFEGLLKLKADAHHPLFNKDIPVALITGGGPGVMELGNRVAQKMGILSCANIVDFRKADLSEQNQNSYIEAKMTYRIDRLVERQAEFNLDFPIFLMGGMGTDFEFALEVIRRKVSIGWATPILLLGEESYWAEKVTPNFQANLKNGTIAGSEWVSNCFYCTTKAEQALKVYEQFFSGELPIGKEGPTNDAGFFTLR